MTQELKIKAEEVFSDIRSAAWLEQELHPELHRHRRHQMADICEADNIDRVWRVLGNAVAELRLALLRLLAPSDISPSNDLACPDHWTFTPNPSLLTLNSSLFAERLSFLREKIHEYMVAAVMADRAAVIIPACADTWRTRAADALSDIRQCAATTATHVPVRRPLWP